MRYVPAAVVVVAVLAGCSQTVVGTAAPAMTSGPVPTERGTPTPSPTPSRPSCLIGDGCADDDPVVVVPTGPDCTSLPAAVAAFGGMAFGGERPGASGTRAETARVHDAVAQVVAVCGHQAMLVVAEQYGDWPLYVELVSDAYDALGDLVLLPEGLLCRDLQALGRTAKDAVDYWSYWGGPDEMDADLDGVPCETVWPDAGQFLPSWA